MFKNKKIPPPLFFLIFKAKQISYSKNVLNLSLSCFSAIYVLVNLFLQNKGLSDDAEHLPFAVS